MIRVHFGRNDPFSRGRRRHGVSGRWETAWSQLSRSCGAVPMNMVLGICNGISQTWPSSMLWGTWGHQVGSPLLGEGDRTLVCCDKVGGPSVPELQRHTGDTDGSPNLTIPFLTP